MSLTSFLELNKDVREQFRQEFQKPRFSVKKNLLAPPLTKRYSLIGTAFDYLLRFYLRHLNPNAVARGRWVAEAALARITDNPPLLSMGEKIVSQAKERLRVFLETGQMSDELMESALLLAQLDPIFRAGVGHEYVGNIYGDDVEDLRNLISIVDPDVFRAKELCLVNPIFGMASAMVSGADADLVIDDTIIDIKTTKNLKLQRKDFDQLIGYYVLHEIAGVGELMPKPEITKVAVYFSRHAYLHILDLQNIIDRRTFPDFIHWFKSRASQEYGIVSSEFIDNTAGFQRQSGRFWGDEAESVDGRGESKFAAIFALEEATPDEFLSGKPAGLLLERFIEELKRRGFEVSPRSARLYYHSHNPDTRFAMGKRVIRVERKNTRSRGRPWRLVRSFSIARETHLALKAVDILLEESEGAAV